MSNETKKLYDWLEEPCMMDLSMKNWDKFAILFAKNDNSLLVQNMDVSIGKYGLGAGEALQLAHFNGVVCGFLIAINKHTDPEFITDKVLNILIQKSKVFGYNIGKKPMLFIKPINGTETN